MSFGAAKRQKSTVRDVDRTVVLNLDVALDVVLWMIGWAQPDVHSENARPRNAAAHSSRWRERAVSDT